MAGIEARRAGSYQGLRTRLPSARRYHLITAWTVWLLVAANTVVILALWYNGGNVTGVHNTGEFLTSLGRLTGLISAYQALIQVLLLARLPWLERAAGFDRLTVWHRLNGKVCLYLVLAHVVLTTVGYQLMDRISLPSEISSLLSNYPGMIAAVAGTVLFIVVVVSSLVIVRRRLRFEAWYFVHITVYAGIALAWVHQIPTGNEFAINQAAATYWNALYIATAVILVLFRVIQPLVQAMRYRLRVSEVIVEGPNVVSLRITGRRIDRLHPRAGQFFLWRFLTRNRWWEAHPFSLSAAPDGRSFRITVKDLGDFSGHIGEIKPGTFVSAEGPFGVFTAEARRSSRVVLIAGGIGITPIRALLDEMRGDIALIYRVLREEDLIFRAELETLAREHHFALFFVVGDHAAPGGERLMSPDHLRELVPDIADREVFVCGPPAMAQFIEDNVRRANVPAHHIHTERFAL